jgi:hypothetical protein
LIKDNQQTDFQLSRRQKRSRCAGPLHCWNDGGTFLTDSAFDIAYATFYALVRYTRCGKGKTAALLQDLFAIEAWANPIRAVGHGERREIIRAAAIEMARLGTHRRAEAE